MSNHLNLHDDSRREEPFLENGVHQVWLKSVYERDIVLLLCCLGFVGFAGIHRLYVGKIGTGILWFFTGGLFGIGTIYDLLCLFKGSFTDSEGRFIIQS